MAPPLNAVGYHGVPIVATIAVLGALCIIATLSSPTGRDWLGFTGCDSSIPMEEYVVLRAKKLLEERGKAMSCDIEDTIMRMSRSELWQFVQDAENAGSAPPVGSPQNVHECILGTQDSGNPFGIDYDSEWPEESNCAPVRSR